jgi:hypothetical protein
MWTADLELHPSLIGKVDQNLEYNQGSMPLFEYQDALHYNPN